jgi:uncharacterized protein YkwD
MSLPSIPDLLVCSLVVFGLAGGVQAAEPQRGDEEEEFEEEDEPAIVFEDELPEGTPQERLAAAYEALYAALDGRDFAVAPRKGVDTAAALEAQHGVGIDVLLETRAKELDLRLAEIGAQVCAWLPVATDPAVRERVLGEEAELDALRAEALALIEVYEKRQQNQVDANRKRVESAYAKYAELVASVFAGIDETPGEEAAELLERIRLGERAFALVEGVLVERGGIGIERADAAEYPAVFTPPGTFFDAVSPHLPDIAYLLLLSESESDVELLKRIDPLQTRIDVRPTPIEEWLVRELRARGVERFNARVVQTATPEDAAFTPIINDYRRGLGLDLLTVDERLLLAARQHSQEQADLDYFDHESPTARRRSPWDRVRLEDYLGGVAENLAQGLGGGNAKGAFEGWYRSPGHHRNMVGPHHQLGAATDSGRKIWTLVLGKGDTRWRDWHPDLAPQRRRELAKDGERLAKTFVNGKLKKSALEKEFVPVLREIAPLVVGLALTDGASQDDGARRHAIDAHAKLVELDQLEIAVECALLMQVLDIAVTSEDHGVRKSAEEALRALVPGLAPELDALKDGGLWETVRVAFEDRERVTFKAGRP